MGAILTGLLILTNIGVLVGAYVYDGLGRVISRTWPVNLTSACKEHQHFYYDGARRIQEQSLVESGSGCATQTWITRREYIQGADYIDEYVAEVTNPACDCAGSGTDTCGGGGSTSGHCGSPTNDRALAVYYLQDANYNVVATLDDGCPDHSCGSGDGGCTGSGNCPEGPVSIYEQYTYEPYGQPSSVDKFVTTPPQNPVGHQGLIFDRYCGDTPTDPCILTTQKGLYENRNRFYHAKLGRFITPDPNSSAIPLIEGATFHGQPPTALALVTSGAVSEYSPTSQYGDGMSLYGYQRANPVKLLDLLGLSGDFDWFNEGDDIIADIQGDRAAMARMYYNLGVAGMDVMGAASVAALEILVTVYVPGGALMVSAWNTYKSIDDIYDNGLNVWNGVSLGLNGFGFLGEFARITSKFTRAFTSAKMHYASTIAGRARLVPNLDTLEFSAGAIRGMSRGGRCVPRSAVEQILRDGARIPDPQGVANTFLYQGAIWVNGGERCMEVLWNAETNTVWHVLLKG